MKIAVLSDIHGNLPAFQAVLDDLKKHKIDDLILLGDYIAKGPSPHEICDVLRTLNPLAMIQGNTDGWATCDISGEIAKDAWMQVILDWVRFAQTNIDAKDITFLSTMPKSTTIRVCHQDILCVHGSPRKINEAVYPDMSLEALSEIFQGVEADVVLLGHSHEGFSMVFEDMLICNPGSIGETDEVVQAFYGILTIEEGQTTFKRHQVEYDTDQLIRVAHASGFPHIEAYEKMLHLKG